jgi:uncharacterized membrane protein YukC
MLNIFCNTKYTITVMAEAEDISPPIESEYVTSKKDTKRSDTKNISATTGIPVVTYVFIGLFITVLLALLYYAYYKFVDNSITKTASKKKYNDRSDKPISDFNLQDTINGLKAKQDNVLRRLSSDVGI